MLVSNKDQSVFHEKVVASPTTTRKCANSSFEGLRNPIDSAEVGVVVRGETANLMRCRLVAKDAHQYDPNPTSVWVQRRFDHDTVAPEHNQLIHKDA